MNQYMTQFASDLRIDHPEKLEEVKLRGDGLSADRYISRDYAREEWQKMWQRTWNIAGMAYHVAEPGDYICTELAHDSIICVRQEDGSLRAFYNSCPHRGTRVTGPGDGYVPKFVCPYHGWEFNHAGEVIHVPDEADFPQGSPCGNKRLKEVRCEELFGLVWFNMSDEAPSLRDYLGETIVQEISSYQIENMVRVLNMTADSPCNWKLITDNFNEAYHVQTLHPALIPYIETDYRKCQFDLMPGGHNRGWFPAHSPSSIFEGEEVHEPLPTIMREWDLDPEQYKGADGIARIRTDLQKAKREKWQEKGYHHYENFADCQLTDYIIYNVFPNAVITAGPDGVQLLRPRPHSSGDPNRCYFDHWWMVHEIEGRTHTPSPAGGPDLPVEDAEHEHIVYGEKTLGTTADEDLSIGKMQQEGLASGGCQDYYLANQERRLQHFHEVLNDYMARD